MDGINLSVKQGEILGIVGESGCGKSTLGRSILRLIEPTSGEVIFEGTNICGLKKEEMRLKRREMQIVFQDPGASLNPRLTVGEIIGEPLEVFHICEGKEKEERIYKLMDLVGINRAYINRFPHEFSGGQRQRIAIARALIRDPEVIVLDEATSALDSISEKLIQEALENLTKGRTTFIVAHRLSTIRDADKIAVLADGHCVEYGTFEELMARKGEFYRMKMIQS